MILLADFLVALHFLLVLYITGGELLVIIGGLARWPWIRRRLFRFSHLLAILVVAGQALAGLPCPLTVWEYRLREAAGQTAEWQISFVGRLLRRIIFYEFPPQFFTLLHVGFAGLVLLSLLLWPPRTSNLRPRQPDRS